MELAIVPEPKIITEKAAPNAAACAIPSVKGEPRGLRRTDCITAPETASPAPATIAVSTWGSLILKIIISNLFGTDKFGKIGLVRLFTTSTKGICTAPSESPTTNTSTRHINAIVINITFFPIY
jgi:hypothetical protein